MLSSIKGKFIIISVAFIVFTVGIPLIFLVVQFRDNFHQRSQIMLESTLDMLDSGLDNVMMLGEEKNVQHIIKRISMTKSVNHIRLFNKEGIIRQSSDSSEIGKSIFEIAPHHVPENYNSALQRQIRMLNDYHAYAAFQPVLNKPECQNCHSEEKVISYLDVDTHLTKAEIQFYTGTVHFIFLGVAVILTLSLGLLFLFNKYINKPLHIFSKALDKVENGELTTRLEVKRRDEFGKLNSNFNNMVSKLETYRSRINNMHHEQLFHSDKLATIGELTSQMSHEINNFTGIALTRSDYLLMEAEKNQALNEFKNDIEVIQNEIERVSTLTKSVLRHSRKRKVSFVDVNLSDVLTQCIQMLEPASKQKNIKIERICNCNGKRILADAGLMEQVFINLITNAFDAIKNDGKIEISCSYIEDKIEVSIKDNGCGMEEETLGNIFSPFFTTKEDDKGTGLGLYIVKTICTQHKADIKCESKLNEGTKFIITFHSGELSDD